MSGVLNLGATLITSIWIILQACRTIEVRHWSLRHWSLRHLLALTIARNVTLACHGNTLIADTCHSNNWQVWCHSQKEHTVDPVWRIWRCDITRLLQQITVTPASGNHSIAIVTIVLIHGMRKCHVTAITAIHVYHAEWYVSQFDVTVYWGRTHMIQSPVTRCDTDHSESLSRACLHDSFQIGNCGGMLLKTTLFYLQIQTPAILHFSSFCGMACLVTSSKKL